MKKNLLVIVLIVNFFSTKAQKGLEGVLVEKYYVSDSIDEKWSSGALHAGSVTYRIFLDLLPGYRFQAAYGVPGHPLQISTSTYFFNDESWGAVISNDVPSSKLNIGTVMLDSWLSVGAGSESNYAILKDQDTSGAILNREGILQNSDPICGIPIKKIDGLFPASPISITTLYGIDSSEVSLFKVNNPSAKGQKYFLDNGSWASFGGSIGPDSSNKVLIAQITTDGDFSFELNIQIGTPSGSVQNYVASNPIDQEVILPELTYSSTIKKDFRKKKR